MNDRIRTEGSRNLVEAARGEFAEIMAEAVDRSRLVSLPSWIVRTMGEGVEMLTRSQRVSSRRFREETWWEPGYPRAREGLPSVVDRIREAG